MTFRMRTMGALARRRGRRRDARGSDGADQRRRRHLPEPDLLEVVQRVQQAATRTCEINYQSIGSGGGIRRSRERTVFFGATDGPMTPEQLAAAPGKILHFPTVLGAVVPVYNIPGVTAGAEVHRPGARRHLPRQDHEVERPGDRQAERRRDAAGHRHRRRAPLGRIGHDLYLGRLSCRRSRRNSEDGRRRDVGQLAGRRRRQGQRGRRRPRQPDARRARLRRARSTRCRTRSPYGAVQNSAGKFVQASIDAVTAAAAAAAAQMPADFRVSITNPPGTGRVPDRVVHLAAALREPAGQGAGARSWSTS